MDIPSESVLGKVLKATKMLYGATKVPGQKMTEEERKTWIKGIVGEAMDLNNVPEGHRHVIMRVVCSKLRKGVAKGD
ncbi:hypothetical protein A3H65_01505 [Candidatus Giovannonibacteria bacterium RIFCSPLOWO2_02_FULL_45_14]|uniref:Uncharacterized protein n=1 Tax=Candidatus Giovannonibacteria bacterium RIFCSPLOWO2_12_FULL_44_15 TaxID=1798364 RepID=A0A1F5XZC8_9BACT|nr:MAG: hypothetical protein A3C75_03405 [Candidatus Giovannonibacteria bacterium RIFCSPHIGHO2_02_FULL_44_31]OGF77067.1 MAG: hypothetical protein A3E62_02585 [Candidatus Giovannonibacteria bacterium RIFCSPHIGHO2_12_FULL_44_29]OGF90820.1 MAG: hypothetical protein A3H65_01505 [Candidatus Giovannonibacteria bacterium RIFCSPLOWO2_02_FULL_45_14]OGF93246.1 MAG: hypothetical protein A3G54_01420 [Candidatus Giovannonibacteria bacterium RIFCSPLOWO2_12_FULL_44_15]